MKLMRWSELALLIVCAFALSSCFNSSNVKIGVIAPEKGSLSEYGYQIRSGIGLAYNEIKANAKLQNKYELVFENEDETNLADVQASFMRLKEQGVRAIIGPASSAATLELVALAEKHKIVLLSPACSSPVIDEEARRFVYRNYPSDTLEAQALSSSIFQKIRLQKVMMVRAKNTFSEGMTYELLKFARQNSRSIPDRVVKFDHDPSKVDWKAVVDDIVTAQPHALFLAAYTDGLIPLIGEIRSRPELDKVFLFSCSAFVLSDAVESLGKEKLEGLMFTAYPWEPNSPTDPNVQNFNKKFTEVFHTQPGIFAATGYDALNILVNTFENADDGLPDDLTEYMNKTNFSGLLGETDFNKTGSITRIPKLYRIVNGGREEVSEEVFQVLKETVLTDSFYNIATEEVPAP